jgi:hypothetical protein
LQQARLEAEQAGRNSPACDVPLQPGQLIELVRLLREQSLAALERFHSLAPPLRRHLGENRFEITRDHVDNLRFLEAAKVFTDFAGPA